MSRSDHKGCACATRNELVASGKMGGGEEGFVSAEASSDPYITYAPTGQPSGPNTFGLFGLHVVASVQHCAGRHRRDLMNNTNSELGMVW